MSPFPCCPMGQSLGVSHGTPAETSGTSGTDGTLGTVGTTGTGGRHHPLGGHYQSLRLFRAATARVLNFHNGLPRSKTQR